MRRWAKYGAVLVALAVAGCSKYQPIDPISKLEAPPALPEVQTTYIDMGRQFLKRGQADMAKAAFIRSIREEGLTAPALTGAGLAAEQQGLLREARRFFERARIKAPTSVLAHNNLGAVLYRMGAYHEAKQAFQAAFALSSGTNRVATHNLALTELAIRRKNRETLAIAPNPTPIQREGSGEYRLLAGEPSAKPEKSEDTKTTDKTKNTPKKKTGTAKQPTEG